MTLYEEKYVIKLKGLNYENRQIIRINFISA